MPRLRVIGLGVVTFTTGIALSVALAGTGVPAAKAAGSAPQIFYSDPGADSIGGANLDGTDVNNTFISGASGLQEMTAVNGYLYWANGTAKTIGRASLDGSGVNQSFISTGGANGPVGVAVDGQYVYWTDGGDDTIGRANLNGTDVNNAFISTGTTSPVGIAADSNYIYWTDASAGDSIGRANLDGTGVNTSFISGLTYPLGIAVNASYIYWSDGDDGSIGRASLDGSGVNQSFISTGEAAQIAIDSSKVYWLDCHSEAIEDASLSGSGSPKAIATVGGGCYAEGLALPVTLGATTAPTAPVLTVSGNVAPVKGTVFIRQLGASTFVPLSSASSIPFGSTINATNGTVTVTVATPSGGTESGNFYDGEFTLTQAKNGFAVETLAGGSFSGCPTNKTNRLASTAVAAKTGKTVVRKLWGSAHGSFTTAGKAGAATVLGTIWLTEDRCDGTYFKAVKDSISVTPKAHPGEKHMVKQGQSYLVPLA
jgi:virginiamycin B lyase